MGAEVVEWCKTKGWEPDSERTFGDECALMHSEISEALEAYRDWGFDDVTLSPDESPENLSKPEGVGSEFADLLIRLLHYSTTHGFDLEAEYERKMAYNHTRAYRHGGRKL
jgi:hypothetical protein